MEIIAVTNQKGGTGKTTTVANLGAFLSLAGKRVLVIDLDPQGAATTGLGIEKRGLKTTIYKCLFHQLDPTDVILPTVVEDLYIIPSNLDLAGAELELIQVKARDSVLKSFLGRTKNQFDYLLIDTPPSLGLLTLNALFAATWVLVPLQPEFYPLEGLANLFKILELVNKSRDEKVKVSLLLTMVNKRTKLTKEVRAQLKPRFDVFETEIPRNVRLAEAPSHGKPACLYAPSSKGAIAYSQLAKEVMEK
jgi:chromosome partitioning protein